MDSVRVFFAVFLYRAHFLASVNIGLLAGASRAFYTQPHLRSDRKVIASTAAAALAILGVEGFAAEKYHETPQGREEARRAKQEGTLIYKVSVTLDRDSKILKALQSSIYAKIFCVLESLEA